MEHPCHRCNTRKYCVNAELNDDQLLEFGEILSPPLLLSKGAKIFSQGDQHEALFIIRSGSVKTLYTTKNGVAQITGFHFPGTILGIDGLDGDALAFSAVTLETSAICSFSYADFDTLANKYPSLRKHLISSLSKELSGDKQKMLVQAQMNAEQRFASFILDIASKKRMQGLSDRFLSLSMARKDVANYLGVAVETISRLFTRFEKMKIIRYRHRDIEVLDPKRLRLATRTNSDPQN